MMGEGGRVLRRPKTPEDFYAVFGKSLVGGALYDFASVASGDVPDLSEPNGYLYKTAADGWDTGAASGVATAAGDCEVYRTIPWNAGTAPTDSCMIGLVDHDNAVTLNNTKWGLYYYPSTGWLRGWESGSEVHTGATATPGDKLSVRRTGTTIEYLKNDVVVYTSSVSGGSSPLRPSANVYRQGGSDQIYFEDNGVDVPITWQHTVGVNTARNLITVASPTYGLVSNGHAAIKYSVTAKHVAYVNSVGPTESAIIGAIVNISDAVNQTQVWGSFFGTSYSMLYFVDSTTVAWRSVSGATVAVNVGVPTKDAGQYIFLGQIDRSSPRMRGGFARRGKLTKNDASAAGLGGWSDIFGPNSYNSAGLIRVEWGFVIKGAQCEGATVIDEMAARAGAL